MKRLFRRSQSRKKAQKTIGFTLSFFLLVSGALTATLAQAQGDRNLREQEDQLIRQFDLPSAPSRAPVYRPRPQQAPPRQDTTTRPPRREAQPSRPRRRAAEAPAPRRQRQQEEAPAPRPRRAPSVVEEAPAPRPRRRIPAVVPDEAPAPRPRRRTQVEEAAPPARTRTTEEPETTTPQGQEKLPNLPSAQYVMEFNRSPIVGNSLRLRGTYAVGRVAFTRPRGWKVRGARAVIRFQHSAALFGNRSNLTVLVNGKSVGSVPLNRKPNQIGQAVFNVPANLIQDFNVINLVAQQNNTQNCSDPGDATLWTEILPDSKLIFSYQPQPMPLNFSNYPFPFFDDLALDANRIVYLQPSQVSQAWLTAIGRLHAGFGRLADFRPMTTDLVQAINQVEANERLAIVGTPTEQPALASLDLPVPVSGNQILDRNRNPLPEDVGVLMLTTNEDGSVPILVATGNGAEGVNKAVQFLAQPDAKKMGTGQVILVDKLKDVPAPSPRKWPRFLPEQNTFKLSDIKKDPTTDEPVKDITIRGTNAEPVEFDFHALPDDRFLRGSSMNLVYSYGPQANPRTSAVEVLLDGVFIGGARLTSETGESRKSLRVDLPPNLVKPNSKIQVFFRLNSKEPFDKNRCIQPPIEQLSGTLHGEETTFDLKRETSVQLPDLELLQFGFPFAAPQDLSTTAVVVPEKPTDTDILTMLAFSERLGRLSKSDGIKLDVYQTNELPEEVRKADNLVGIGIRQKFPFQELANAKGFNLGEAFSRSSAQGSVQTFPDSEGMIKQIMSPWNGNRVLLALTAQSDAGLDRVRQILLKDPWFFQLKDDTVLISSNQQDPAAYDPDAYRLDFFRNAPERKRLEETNPLSKASRMLQDNWVLLPVGILGIGLLLYGVSQIYLKRINVQDKK